MRITLIYQLCIRRRRHGIEHRGRVQIWGKKISGQSVADEAQVLHKVAFNWWVYGILINSRI